MFKSGVRVLAIAAHTDDEFGCAGTLMRFVESGADIHYVALSRCEESVPTGMPVDVLETECRACLDSIGISSGNVQVLRFAVRWFPSVRQEILESLVRMRKELNPDIVLLPSSFDTHQDHRVVYEEGFRAFKQSTILGYELPQNLISFSNSAFVHLTQSHLERKLAALAAYRSQEFRPYAAPSFIEALARVRGVQCGASYAEAFEVVRYIVA